MRTALGIAVGLVCGLSVFFFAWNPDRFYPFSEEWNPWEVVSNETGPRYRTSLKWYPVVSCTIVPQVRDGYIMRVGVHWSGFTLLPLLTADGRARLEYECISWFKSAYVR